MDGIYLVGLLNAYIVAKRLQGAKGVVLDRQAWTAGKPLGRMPTASIRDRWLPGMNRVIKKGPDWRPPRYKIFLKIVKQIEKKFDVHFARSPDGCPFP